MTSIIANKSVVKIAAVVVGVAFLFSLAMPAHAALTESQIQSILSLLQSFGADASTVANVNASLRGQAPTGGTSGGSSASCSQFTQNLTLGSTGADVQALQVLLNANGAQVAASGAGSPGNESQTFGPLTQAALAKWQAAHGVTPPAGYFGPITRAALASSGACGASSTGGTTPPAPAGSGLTVSAGNQPANALAPQGASRVPYTRFNVTAGSDGPVTMNSVVVQRVGPGSNASFAGVILVDQDGNQIGTDKSFNSNDQATVGEAVVIPAGQTRSFLIAGNMNTSLASTVGEAPGISVININTSAAVSGSFPITGAFHTNNSTLVVGSVTVAQSNANATNANATKEIGTTAYKSGGLRLTAGSAEDLRFKMLRYNQTGSVSTVNDLANLKIVVDGTAYPVTISADGKYVSANFGTGILVPEGNSVEVYVQYDIVGGNSNNRTVIFDVDETTDILFEGVIYGYGVSPAASSTAVPTSRGTFTITNGTPYVYDTQVTISGASVTSIAKDNTVPAQNIAVNLSNQPLGGYIVDIKGEAITVQSTVFSVATTSGAGRLTNVSIVDENGATVAGPVDLPATASGSGTLTFTDSITYQPGIHKYQLRGKIAAGSTNNATYIISTTPSSQWTNVKGDITGNTISLSGNGLFSMNTMTIKSPTLVISRASSPASQTVVAGGTSVLMVNFQLDATESGEDVRLSSFPVLVEADSDNSTTEGDYDLLTSCQLFDGSLGLNTGSNVLNPTGATTTADYTATATFDNPVVVSKGGVKTLGLRCNISASTASGDTFTWDHGAIGTFSATGAVSGEAITETQGGDSDIVVTVSTGSTTVTTDASSPGYKLVSAGQTDVVVAAYKFRATNEAVNLTKLGLTLTNTASSAPGDLVKVTVYDGATPLGSAFFTGSNTTATSTFSSAVLLPKDQDKTLTVKADLSNIGVSQSVAFSGHLLAVDYLNAEGVGAESGITQRLGVSAGSTAVAGARIMKSFPTVAKSSLPSTGIADGRLMRFAVTADSQGPVSVTEFNFTFATTTATLSNVNVFAYEDANFSNSVSGLVSGAFNNNLSNSLGAWADSTTNFEFTAHNGTASSTLQIPANGTRYFEVRGTVTGSASGASITTTLKGASAFVTGTTPTASGTNPLATAASANFGNDFIWSPNSTTTSARADLDWTGGFNVSGLPSNGLIETRSN